MLGKGSIHSADCFSGGFIGVVSYQVEAHLWFVAIPLTALAGTTLISALRAIPTDL